MNYEGSSSYNKPYGTYERVKYQTVDFTSFKKFVFTLIKAILILTIVVSSVILLSAAVIFIVPYIIALVTSTQFIVTSILLPSLYFFHV